MFKNKTKIIFLKHCIMFVTCNRMQDDDELFCDDFKMQMTCKMALIKEIFKKLL